MRSRPKLIALILGTILLSAGVYLVGNDKVALFDRDEPRYAECSREMLQSGDWIVPRFLGELRTAKPPGIYWLQAGVMKKLGDTAFSARLPSAIAMTLVLALFAIAVWKLAGPSRAAWATLILATSAMTIVSAKACLTDAVLLLFVTTAQFCLYAVYRGRGGWIVTIILCLAIGAAGLVKGPVVLAVLGTTLVELTVFAIAGALRRRFFPPKPEPRAFAVILPGDSIEPVLPIAVEAPVAPRTVRAPTEPFTRPADPEGRVLNLFWQLVVGVAIVVACVGPWLYAINKAEPSFLPTIIGHDVVNRMKTGLEGHSAPPGYHLLTIWGTYFPWSILLPMTFVYAFKRRHLPLIRFALATSLGSFIFFECVKTKLPHYLLPIYPWLALLTADVIVRGLRGLHQDLINNLTRNAMTVWGSLIILLGLAPWGFYLWFPANFPYVPTLAWTLTGLMVGVAVIVCFRTRRPRAGLIVLGLGHFAVVAVLFGYYLPKTDFLRTPILAGHQLRELGLTDKDSVQMLDYKEPSLAFYQGGTIRENSNLILTAELARITPAYLVITNDVWDKSADEVKAMYEIVKEYPTLAYADSMRRIKVMIIKRK